MYELSSVTVTIVAHIYKNVLRKTRYEVLGLFARLFLDW